MARDDDGDHPAAAAAADVVVERNTKKAHAALWAAALIYAGYNLVLARAVASVSPVLFSLAREVCSVVVLYAWARCAEGPLAWSRSRSDALRFALLGLFLGAFQLCFAVGVALTDAKTAALFQCVEPSTAAAMGAILNIERSRRSTWVSALLAGSGVALLESHARISSSRSKSVAALGCVALFSQGVGIAAYCLLQKRLVRGEKLEEADDDEALLSAVPRTRKRNLGSYGPITVTAHAYATSILLLVLAAATSTAAGLEEPPPLSAAALRELSSKEALGALAYAVVFSSVVGYSLRAWANKYVEASTLVLYNALQPPATALLAFAFGNDAVYGPREIGATLLVLLAVAVAARDVGPRQPAPPRDSTNGLLPHSSSSPRDSAESDDDQPASSSSSDDISAGAALS